MPTFKDVIKALPPVEEKQTVWIRRIYVILLVCVLVFVVLVLAGWITKRVTLIYASYIPVFGIFLCLLAYILFEARSMRKMLVNDSDWLGNWLDQKFEAEKHAADILLDGDVLELKRMAARVDAEITTQEKWLEVIKPFSLLIPAVLIISTSKYLMLPVPVQDAAKMIGAALVVGLSIGAVTTYSGLLKLRRLFSILNYAVCAIEDKKPISFRKVSRRRQSASRGQDTK